MMDEAALLARVRETQKRSVIGGWRCNEVLGIRIATKSRVTWWACLEGMHVFESPNFSAPAYDLPASVAKWLMGALV